MKIVYMGTPDFAVQPLKGLIEGGCEISLAVSQPDRPRDRGKRMQPTPVKSLAAEHGIPLFQPEKAADNEELYRLLLDIAPDIIVVAAYGRLLPEKILEIPPLGCVNIHASLLPKHRGAAPIQHAILSGDEETGVTLMYMSAGMDEGDMIAKISTPIDKKTAGELFTELSLLGTRLLLDTLPLIKGGRATRTAQDEGLATYAGKISKDDSHIDFMRSAGDIERLIRAMNPSPGAHTIMGGKVMKIFTAEVIHAENTLSPGTVKEVGSRGILTSTGGGDLLLKRIQMPGKQALDAAEFIKGNKIEIGTVLG
ncbi:methionyl-tRNA formyltransferase [Bacillota bacterium]